MNRQRMPTKDERAAMWRRLMELDKQRHRTEKPPPYALSVACFTRKRPPPPR